MAKADKEDFFMDKPGGHGIIAIDKPAGLACDADPGLRNSVLAAAAEDRPWGRLHLVHRLDVNVTGVLLLGRSGKAAARARRAFERGEVRKKAVDAVLRTRSEFATAAADLAAASRGEQPARGGRAAAKATRGGDTATGASSAAPNATDAAGSGGAAADDGVAASGQVRVEVMEVSQPATVKGGCCVVQ